MVADVFVGVVIVVAFLMLAWHWLLPRATSFQITAPGSPVRAPGPVALASGPDPATTFGDLDGGGGPGIANLALPRPALAISTAFLVDLNSLPAAQVKRILCDALQVIRDGLQSDFECLGVVHVHGPVGSSWSLTLYVKAPTPANPCLYELEAEVGIIGA